MGGGALDDLGNAMSVHRNDDPLCRCAAVVRDGVAIVADSEPDSEWAEINKKALTVLRAAELTLSGLNAKHE